MTFGEHGWYWTTKSGRIGVVITNHRLLNKYFAVPDFKYRAGDEDVRHLSEAEFRTRRIARMLKVDLNAQSELSDFHNQKFKGTSDTILTLAAWRNQAAISAKNQPAAAGGCQ
jgi:hypothetical protein